MRYGGFVFAIAILGTLGCGGGPTTGTSARSTGAEGAPPGGNGNHPVDPDELAATDADAGSSALAVPADEIVVSGHGFAPQPAIRSGAAGATSESTSRDGSSLDPSCVGTFPPSPQHSVKLGGPISLLRIVVDSDGNDLTLAIRTPDGIWHCNDDSGDPMNGLNPTVELYSPPPGEIEVWVGTYSAYYSGAAYRLAVTEQPGYASDILRH